MLALIAGQGALPRAVAEAAPEPPLICALEPYRPEGLAVDKSFRIERLGSFLHWLKVRGVTRICMCGRVRRPEIRLTRLDWRTALMLPAIRRAIRRGDDGALRIVIGLLEEAGFEVVGAHEVAPALLMPEGVATRAQPGPDLARDMALADRISVDQGRADLGQACVIRDGRVVVQEDDAGTDAMLARLPEAAPGTGGILFKGPKFRQERRADLPVIGPNTAKGAIRAGLSGIVIDARGVMVLDRPALLRRLDEAGLFLLARKV
ncbi:LpxI family protein [Salipiger abyssi]|uniref:LpxI family protein n=1 Tax=Salipiger abyssi TaxID=1250539 RepID=UPI0040580320